jgi:hypothetical protein
VTWSNIAATLLSGASRLALGNRSVLWLRPVDLVGGQGLEDEDLGRQVELDVVVTHEGDHAARIEPGASGYVCSKLSR